MALTLKQALAQFWIQITNKFVSKESGKGLSTNDFTTEEKNKLASLENITIPTVIIKNSNYDKALAGENNSFGTYTCENMTFDEAVSLINNKQLFQVYLFDCNDSNYAATGFTMVSPELDKPVPCISF